eukprot:gene18005-18242_t
MIPILETPLGRLYQADCITMMRSLPQESVDLAFADPPFNLGKSYSSKINDNLGEPDYLIWCRAWLDEMIRVLKPDYGGYKDKMNPKGVNLSDVWTDIPPVRHAKYKKRDANGLALKLMDRIIPLEVLEPLILQQN